MRVLFFGALVALVLGATSIACGGAAPAPASPAIAAPPPKPRNAPEIARAVANGGGVEALLHADRVRGHPLSARVSSLKDLRAIFEGTGVDPARDIERAFVVAPTATSEEQSVVVAEHTVEPARLHAALEVVRARSEPPGVWRTDLGVPATTLTVRGRKRVAAMVEPNVLVLLPEGRASQAARFVGTAGCPLPTGAEAMSASAVEPARTLRGTLPVRIPESLRRAQAKVTPTADGGADLRIDAESSSPAQASADAASLTRELARATSVDLGLVRLRVIEPIEFRAEGDRVLGDRHLSAAELDRIFSLVEALMPP